MTTARTQLKVNRAVDTLILYKNVRIDKALLCDMVSTPHLAVTPHDLQALWDLIEREVVKKGLLLVRPLSQLGYRAVASDIQQLVLVQQRTRDRYIQTMMERDVNLGLGNLGQLAKSPNARTAVYATRVLDRDRAWLLAKQESDRDLGELLGASLDAYLALPYAYATVDGIMVQPVGPNGLPVGSAYSLNGHH